MSHLKSVIREFDNEFRHIQLDDIAIIRTTDNTIKHAKIISVDPDLRDSLGKEYIIKIHDRFETLLSDDRDRIIFHVLCAIPKYYKDKLYDCMNTVTMETLILCQEDYEKMVERIGDKLRLIRFLPGNIVLEPDFVMFEKEVKFLSKRGIKEHVALKKEVIPL